MNTLAGLKGRCEHLPLIHLRVLRTISNAQYACLSVRKVRRDAMPVDTNCSRHLLRGRKRAIAVERLTHVGLRSVISVRLHSSTILSFGLPSFTTHKDCDFSGLSMAGKINENPEFELAFLGKIVSKLLGKGANGVEARRRVVSLAGEIGLNQSQNWVRGSLTKVGKTMTVVPVGRPL
jgi:hypothetical protein